MDRGLHIGWIEVYSKSGQGSPHWMDRSLLKEYRQGCTHWTDRSLLKEWTGVYTLDIYRSLLKEWTGLYTLDGYKSTQRVDRAVHIGRIEVYSKSGQGSTHWIYIYIEVYSKSGQGSTHWMDRSLLKEWTGVYTLDR